MSNPWCLSAKKKNKQTRKHKKKGWGWEEIKNLPKEEREETWK